MLTVKNDAIQDTVTLEDEGDLTAQYTEDEVPNDNNNQISCETEFQVYPLSHNDEVLPHITNPETRITTQAEPGSLLYHIFDLEMTVLSRSKNDILELASILIDHEGIIIKDFSFHSLVKLINPIHLFVLELILITN